MMILARFRPVIAAFTLTLLAACITPQALRSQTTQNTLRFAVYGDTRDGTAVHRRIVEQIMRTKPDFVIQTGDLVGHSHDRGQWRTYDEITGEMLDSALEDKEQLLRDFSEL